MHHNSSGLSKNRYPVSHCAAKITTPKNNYFSISKHVSLQLNKKFLDELIACLPFIQHGPCRKQHQFLFTNSSAGMCLTSHCLATTGNIHADQPTQASNNSSIVVNIHCHGNMFTEPFPSNNEGYTDAQTDGRDLLSILLRWAQVP